LLIQIYNNRRDRYFSATYPEVSIDADEDFDVAAFERRIDEE